MSTVALLFFVIINGHMTPAPWPPTQQPITKADCIANASYFNNASIKDAGGHSVIAFCLIDEP